MHEDVLVPSSVAPDREPAPRAAAPPRTRARDRTSSWWFVTSLAVVCLALAATSTLLAEPDRSRVITEGSNAQPRVLTDEEIVHRDFVVRSTLKKRARAILARDRAAFMADVDRRDKGFVADQERLFDNLAQLEFVTWRYHLTKAGYERTGLTEKYATTAVYLPPVVIHYAIEGYDDPQNAVAVAIVMTFVKRGTDWQIASDSDVDADLPEAGHAEPWDRRAIVVGEGKHVLILADAEDREDLDHLVDVGDESVRRVAAMWPKGWKKKIVVSAVRDQRLIETYFRTELQTSESVAAIAVPTFTEVTNWVNDRPPNREAGLASFRVILNPRYFNANSEFNAHLLTHEITHVATGAYTYAGAPTWLTEGVAEYTTYREQGPVVRQIDTEELRPRLMRQLEAGEVYLPDYDFYQGEIESNYLVGHLACEFIARRYGEAMLRKLYLRLGRVQREIYTLEEQEKAFRDLLGVSTATFQQRLATYILRGA